MAGKGLRLTLLVPVALLGLGCASVLPGTSDTSTQEIQRLRARVAQLEREARVREVENRRLRAALSEASPPAPRPEAVEESPAETAAIADTTAAAEAPVASGTEIEEDDLPMEPIESASGPESESGSASPSDGAEATAPSAAAPAPREAQALYDEAYSLFHQGRYQEAEVRFSSYLERFGSTRLADNAQFWIGECRYARGEHEAALEAFRRTVERFPGGNKVPDAMVKAGKCLEALGDLDGARETYREVGRSHPGTAAAAIAEERLLMLR